MSIHLDRDSSRSTWICCVYCLKFVHTDCSKANVKAKWQIQDSSNIRKGNDKCRTVKVMATRPYYIRATFPPLRHFSTFLLERHHCIHRLINHVYTKETQAHSLSLPHDMVAAQIKHWDLRNISLGCVTHCQSIGSVERSSSGIAFSHSNCHPSFMRNKCAC